MCSTGFSYVCIGEIRMILCKEESLTQKKIKINQVAKKAFPELFGKFSHRCCERIQVVFCRKLYYNQFDCQIFLLEKANDWEKFPFVALNLKELGGKTFCHARYISI